jgi:polar amino acid transport system ATP-binding protein
MALLEVNNLTKHFGKTNVLRGVSFALEEGQVLAVIGSSGSGKTTLLRCLTGLEEPDGGSIRLEGGGSFGLVFQSFNLFPQYTALENVMLAPSLKRLKPREELRQDALALLAQVGLSNRADNYPWQLSGGQKQRTAIARALAMKPEVLCFDEPTSALDPELTGEVLRTIRGLKEKNYTMIVVTHEMEFARNVADVVIYMADGVIEEMGTPEQIFTAPQSQRTARFIQAAREGF